MARKLKTSESIASGLLNCFQTIASYAFTELEADTSALDEERLGVKVALQSIRPVLQTRLQQRLDKADERLAKVKCPTCGRSCESQGRRERGWQSTVGKLRLKRRYGWCECCKGGCAPAQKQVGLPEGDSTAGLKEVTTLMATTVPHEMAKNVLQKLLGLEISEQLIKSNVERRAAEVIRLQDEEAREIKEYEEKWGKSPPYITEQAPKHEIEVAYLEMDGVLVMAREEKTETEGKIKGGRGGPGRKYSVGGREVKNAVLYEGAACGRESERRGIILRKSYVSSLGDWMSLAVLIWAMMLKQGLNRAKLLVVLSDGAEWIRSLCKWLPVNVFLILDLYHVKHKIWETAGDIYGEGTVAAKEWAKEQCERIEQGLAVKVIESLEFLKGSHPKAREKIESLQTYLRKNQDRMDYPRYREMGLRVGSGAVESANYHVTGARLKLQGMRWSEDGAAKMARLRADLFNGVWQERSRQILKAA
ncbi:MAG: ISKra4 family transposase [Chloracidobacterium sp.]|nr:ISKra4 family transposase [Chloracidobacterium sp.]